MITQHFHSRKYGNYKNIKDFLFRVVSLLERNEINVIRLKIEHEGPNLVCPFNCHYVECHLKISLPTNDRDDILLRMSQDDKLIGWRPSNNPNEMKGDTLSQFLNRRWYSGRICDIMAESNEIKKHCEQYGLVKDCKVESAIYDSNKEHDFWWL